MKKLFIIIFIITPTLILGQEITTIGEDSEKEKKISYSFINEYGFSIGFDMYGFFGAEMNSVFVNGIRFNKAQDEIGIGIGYEYYHSAKQFLPFFLNYRHYFSSKQKLTPLVNIGIGARLYTIFPRYEVVSTGLYSTVVAGFKIKAFSFTSGFFVKSWGNFNFFGGIETKAGFTF